MKISYAALNMLCWAMMKFQKQEKGKGQSTAEVLQM